MNLKRCRDQVRRVALPFPFVILTWIEGIGSDELVVCT